MRLDSIKIEKFRSIKEEEILNCGNFNVLIGKNNSGKSNILAAIDFFFKCIEDGNVVTISPPVGQKIDFYERITDHPIEITLVFELSLADRDILLRDIVSEAPQMKHAVDGIDPSIFMYVTLNINPPPRNFAFVRSLIILDSQSSKAKNIASGRIIFNINEDAALELYDQFYRSRQRNLYVEGLSHIDSTELDMLIKYKSEGRTELQSMINYIFGKKISPEISKELRLRFDKIAEEVTTKEDITREINKLISTVNEEANLIANEPIKNKLTTFAGEESSVPNYVRKFLTQISALKVLYLKERRKQIGEEEARKLLDLKVRRGGTEALRNIQDTVEALLGVKIDAFQSEIQSPRTQTKAELDVDNFLVQANGSGIREALRLVLDFEFQKPNFLLIEEPEVHLHPALETSMMRYLKRISTECQVFLTTHSTNFLDTAEMKNIYLISKPDSTRIKLLTIEEAENKIPKELGIRLSSLFMFDKLVFIEGRSDEDILHEWASILGVNFSQANVGFIHMGGVRNFTHYATENILSFLTRRQVKLWFLMDRDEKDDEDVAKIKARLGDKAISIVLSKREIENYLLKPRPIIEFIKLKRHLANMSIDDPSLMEPTMVEKIDQCCDKLKQVAVDKRVAKIVCQPIFPSRECLFEKSEEPINNRLTAEINRSVQILEEIKKKTGKILEEQSEFVNSNWKINKLSLIPGDILLDMIAKEFSVRFNKEKDSSRLASLMNESEIDHEIKDIIRQIGRPE